MRVEVVGLSGQAVDDELRSLQHWLRAEGELRGRVDAVERPPVPGTLGSLIEALVLILAPGGVATVVAGSLLSWLRERRSDVTVKLTRSDGSSVELSATRVRSLDGVALRAQFEALTALLDERAPESRAQVSTIDAHETHR
ncbi:hypothetical protein O7600_28040 [Micromonospora sp. WMMA1998]|uniref:effector-associated constant component EACC1 n=1 Tax=Micromonospora sp. WMMA1998 TaxID=3015167 RepID=UPI00248AB1B6|nr:hypothetical protein [Micromonospora sp. WMMA1998]WBC14882.1 hypothetical protein O7600_28040 [Micromonospora sp. WMMA1998]